MPTRKLRNIRVKVGNTPLTVRTGPEEDAPSIGLLLPGTIATVVEELITPGNVRACVALDMLIKQVGCQLWTESTLRRSHGMLQPLKPKRSHTLPPPSPALYPRYWPSFASRLR